MHVAVIGLGIIGAATARALTRAGAQVTVFEQDRPGSGTSETSFAWTNAHQKNPRPYHDIHIAGLAEYDALDPEGCSYQRCGNLEWARPEDQEHLVKAVDELLDRGFPVEWIGRDKVRELVPDVLVPETVEAIAWYPQEGYVLPIPLLGRLWGEARDRGAVLQCPARVVSIREERGGAVVEIAGAEPQHVDRVVVAAGRWTGGLMAAPHAQAPMARTDERGAATVGLLGYTPPLPVRMGRVLTTPTLNVRPDGGGRLVLQGLDLDVYADPAGSPAPDDKPAVELCSRLSALIHGTAGVNLDSLRVGRRAIPADGLPVAGFATGSAVYVVATHSGVSLAPLLGRLAAEEILHDEASPLLESFRPRRFDGIDPMTIPALRPKRFAGQQ